MATTKKKPTAKKTTPVKKPVAKKPMKSVKKPLPKKPVAQKAAAKKTVAKKPVAKKAATAKPVAKKMVAKSAPAKKVVAKAVSKPAAKPTQVKVEAKKPAVAVKPVASSAKSAVDTRKTLDRAPAPENKAPITTLTRTANGRQVYVVAPQPNTGKKNFAVGEFVVYPTHGVGRILGHEVEKIGEHELKVFVIGFDKDKMTLRVPVGRAEAAGLRAISGNDQISRAISTLKGRAKIARGMWSRRAQEYEAKINSGNLVAIAEVVRDLHKNVDQSERSYSERMIYETAMHRLCGEVAASEKVDFKETYERLLKLLRKQAAMAA